MSERKSPPKQQRQVTVQPQEPEQPKGKPNEEPKGKPRKAAPGEQDRRSADNRDGLE